MKKLSVLLATLLLSLNALAIPAKPGVITYRQPDGSVIRIELHGDEFFSWATLAGTTQVMVRDDDGFWRPGSLDPAARQKALERRRQMNRQRNPQPRTHDESKIMTHGARHIPVFLVNFKDVAFSIDNPHSQFDALLNEHGYSENGGTGSVQDFYMDNSHGQFQPIFDVYGPVTLPENMVYYGGNSGSSHNSRPQMAAYQAALSLDASVDFSQYDHDGDGVMDMILFYYAGYNEAEGGPADSIWPHQSDVRYSSSYEARNATFDGLRLGKYFCTSELRGNEGVNMCGIGTTCHEFGHSLGLPDFYDTDYAENGIDHGLYAFSTMCSGSYNNQGRTPPYFNAEERLLLGWMLESDIPELPAGPVSFGSVKDDITYRTFTDVEGEYFLYECRDGSGWDAPMPQGMLVYHVDKSTVRTVGGMTPYDQWAQWDSYNTINAYGDHPCFYVVPSADQNNLYFNGGGGEWMFPGSANITSYIPVDWDGNDTAVMLSGIGFADGKVTLNATYSTERAVMGTVTGQDGQPLEGVTVSMTTASAAQAAPRARAERRSVREALTDEKGHFSLSLEGLDVSRVHLTLTKEGYRTLGQDVDILSRITRVELILVRNDETEIRNYLYFDPSGQLYFGGDPEKGNSQMASILIPADELSPDGGRLTAVTFYPYLTAESYYIIVDAGPERILTYRIPGITGGIDKYYTVDLADMNVQFPGGTDLHVGYAVKDCETYYQGSPFIVGIGENAHYASFDLTSSNWDSEEEEGYGLALAATIIGRDNSGGEPEVPVTSFAQMGIPAIADPGFGTYAAGDVFLLEMELPDGVSAQAAWTFDGLPVTDPVTLQAGSHKVTATLTYDDGSTEVFELLIEVK